MTAIFSQAETGLTRLEMISAMVQRALRENAQLVPTVRDVSSLAQPGMDSISFPRRSGKFDVVNLAENADAAAQKYDYELDKLEFNHHAMISWFIKKRANIQSMVNIEADTIAEAAAEHAIDVDRKIIAAMVAGAFEDNDIFTGASTPEITKDVVLNVKENLQKATKLNPRNANFYLMVDSSKERELLNIGDFVKANEYGGDQAIVTGELGRLYGMRVLLTDESELDGHALGYVSQGIAYGNQMAPDFNELYQPKRAGTEYALDQLYGVKVLDGGKYISKVTFDDAPGE